MLRTRILRNEKITYSAAKDQEVNILHQLGYHEKKIEFFNRLHEQQPRISTVVAHHLSLSPSACHVAKKEDWLHGSFNVCVPVTIDGWIKKSVLIRFPLPYRVGEAIRPGNGDEKIRYEAGSYAWLQENCPDIPIPSLYGFALSTGETFTRLERLPIIPRFFQFLRQRILSWLGYPVPSNYVRHQAANDNSIAGVGYLLIEFIEESQGEMLSNTWLNGQNNIKLRKNLLRSLSQIFLSMSRIPLPKIGSFIIDNNGFLRLANRPLSIEIQQLENENIPTNIDRDHTYTIVESYIIDMLSIHDNRFRYQPNAVNDLGDCAYQLSALSGMRTIFPSFFQRDFRYGPFYFTLTDLHQSNIFVDSEWNITCLIDLEGGCSRPIEMLNPPYWLTNKGVDQLVPAEYNPTRLEFMEVLADEEKKLKTTNEEKLIHNKYLLSDIMNQNWTTGTFWYTLGLSSTSGLFNIFHKNIRPLFCADFAEEFNLIMPFLWERKIGYIAGLKVSHKKKYDEDLRQAFESSPN